MDQSEFEAWESGIRDLTPAQCRVFSFCFDLASAMGRQLSDAFTRKTLAAWLADIENLLTAPAGMESDQSKDASVTDVLFLRWLRGIGTLSDSQFRTASIVVLAATLATPVTADAEFMWWLKAVRNLPNDQRYLAINAYIDERMRDAERQASKSVRKESGRTSTRTPRPFSLPDTVPGHHARVYRGSRGSVSRNPQLRGVPESCIDNLSPDSSVFTFMPLTEPFPYWTGPYSPARGNTSGFRVRNGRLGVCVGSERNFRVVEESGGVLELAGLVRRNWGGGRVLFLPSGHVIKPLQEEVERAQRKIIGHYSGGFGFSNNGVHLDFSPSSNFTPGERWQGPTTIGLECTIEVGGGCLTTGWIEPAELSDEEHEVEIGRDRCLASVFKRCRGDTTGRVRITVGRHAITNKKVRGEWRCWYVGQADPSLFIGWDRWIAGP